MATSLFEQKSEDDLWIEYRKTRSSQIRDAFIRQYMPLVKYVAGKVSVGLPGSVEFDDLVGYGQFGLLDAIEKFVTEKCIHGDVLITMGAGDVVNIGDSLLS